MVNGKFEWGLIGLDGGFEFLQWDERFRGLLGVDVRETNSEV